MHMPHSYPAMKIAIDVVYSDNVMKELNAGEI